MPIKTKYEIYDTRHTAPVNVTYDYTAAKVEYNELMRKASDLYRVVCTPMADGALTKPEEYLLLVYRVRKLWKQYFNQGRDHDVLLKSLEEEKKLDDWHKRVSSITQNNNAPTPIKDRDAFQFFVVVREWREAWLERKKYSKQQDRDDNVLREISKKCRDYEAWIDKYINEKLKLI